MSALPGKPSIGVGVVVLHRGKVLLVRRSKPPRAGQWSLPGGRQELGETVAEAGAREVMEETGVAVAEAALLTVIDLIERDALGAVTVHYTLVDLLAGVDGHERGWPEPVAGDDASEARWFGLGDLGGMGLWDETLRVIDLAAKARPFHAKPGRGGN